jgi:hypothetical protein
MVAASNVQNALRKIDVKVKGYDAANDLLKVSSIQKRMRDDFLLAGGLDASKWDLSLGAGMTLSATNGLVITSGTTVNSVTTVTSKDVFTIPMRLSVGVTLSQRIVGQTFLVELVSVDPETLQPDGKSTAAWKFDATTSNSNQYRVGNSGQIADSGYSSTTTTGGGGYFEIEPFTDECWFHSNAIDSTSARAVSFRRNMKCPDPNALYKIRIRVVNGTPASSTTLTVPFVVIDDYAEVMAEISAGRGQGSTGQSMGVQVNNTPTVNISVGQLVSPSPSVGVGSYASKGQLISAATTNSTLIKSSAANISKITAENLSASIRYLKLYDKATAPTVGTDSPFHTYVLPANSQRTFDFPLGLRTTSGFGLGITGALAVTDTTAIGAAEVVINYDYN